MVFSDRLKQSIAHIQTYYILSFQGLTGLFKRPFYLHDTIDQMDYAGASTLVIVLPVALFIGMALSLQIAAEFAILGLQMYTGRVVGISIISEIGPVAIALVFAGRTGSGMASEIGSMLMRNQIDTLRVFGVDPVKKLVTPRIISGIIMLPALTIIGDAVSLFGGYYIVSAVYNQSGSIYWNSVQIILEPRYIVAGAVKPFIFGFIIASISCFTGFSTRGGAVGLKYATTRAFVLSTILIIVFDFIVTRIILYAFGFGI